jgi:hypothetical protein
MTCILSATVSFTTPLISRKLKRSTSPLVPLQEGPLGANPVGQKGIQTLLWKKAPETQAEHPVVNKSTQGEQRFAHISQVSVALFQEYPELHLQGLPAPEVNSAFDLQDVQPVDV